MCLAPCPDALTHAVRRQEAIVLHVHQRREVFAFLRHAADLIKAVPVAVLVPYRLNHPQAHDVLVAADSSVRASLIGQIRLPALFTAVRLLPTHTHQRPCAGADVDALTLHLRQGSHRAGRIMGTRQIDVQGIPGLLCPVLCQLPDIGSGKADRTEELLRKTQRPDQVKVPVLFFRIQQLRRGSLCVLPFLHAGQQVVQIVRRQKHTLRRFQVLGASFPHRHQLVDRVVIRLERSRPAVQFLRSNDLLDHAVHAVGPVIPVPVALSHRVSGFIQEDIVHAPGIDTQADRNLAGLRAQPQAFHDVFRDPLIIPAQGIAALLHPVVEAVDGFQRQLPILQRAQDQTSARGPDVCRRIVCLHVCLPLTAARPKCSDSSRNNASWKNTAGRLLRFAIQTDSHIISRSCTAVRMPGRHGNPVLPCPCRMRSMPPDGRCLPRAHCACRPESEGSSTGRSGPRRCGRS